MKRGGMEREGEGRRVKERWRAGKERGGEVERRSGGKEGTK